MTEIKKKLLEAFEEDHAILGKGFYILAETLRGGDVTAIQKAADSLDCRAGSHIGFEEFEFYPRLKALKPDIDVDQMYARHATGLSIIQSILDLPKNTVITEKIQNRFLSKINIMEAHMAECGDLFAVLVQLPEKDMKVLYEGLVHWRRKSPRWTRLKEFDVKLDALPKGK